MRKMFLGGLFVAGLLGGMQVSNADAAMVYANSIDWFNNGTVGSSNDRDNKSNALGAPDGDFLSVGLSNDGSLGFAVFGFAQDFQEQGKIWEVTFNCSDGCNYLETANIYVGNDLVYDPANADTQANLLAHVNNFNDWTLAAGISNQDAQDGTTFTYTGAFSWLAVVDTTPGGSPSTDGFDVDAVGVKPVPLPAAAWLLITALGGLFGTRWLKGRQAA